MRTVTAREANQNFSKLLREVEDGAELMITHHGRPVARMSPIPRNQLTGEERERVIQEMVEAMREGYPMGGRRFTRDEMHER